MVFKVEIRSRCWAQSSAQNQHELGYHRYLEQSCGIKWIMIWACVKETKRFQTILPVRIERKDGRCLKLWLYFNACVWTPEILNVPMWNASRIYIVRLYTLYNIEIYIIYDTIRYMFDLNTWIPDGNLTETPDSHLVLALLSATWIYHPTWTEAEPTVSGFPYSTWKSSPDCQGSLVFGADLDASDGSDVLTRTFVVSMTRYIKVWWDMMW